MEESLWNFIDGTISASEKIVVEKLLQTDADWKAKYGELLQVNELLQSSELEAPSLRFSKNVMEQISKLHIAPATKSYINKKVIWGIGLFFVTMIVGFLIYGIGQIDFSSGEEVSWSKNISKIDFSKIFSNTWVNAFMMINVILGLVLLDSYFTNKRKEFRKEA
jgi:preprotein translocase subunit Sss1